MMNTKTPATATTFRTIAAFESWRAADERAGCLFEAPTVITLPGSASPDRAIQTAALLAEGRGAALAFSSRSGDVRAAIEAGYLETYKARGRTRATLTLLGLAMALGLTRDAVAAEGKEAVERGDDARAEALRGVWRALPAV